LDAGGEELAGITLGHPQGFTFLLQRFQSRLRLRSACLDGWSLPICRLQIVKESKQITLGSADSTTNAADFTYSMRGKVISITYLGTGSINKEIERILRRIEHWHQGAITSYKILYQDADGLGGEVTWDGEKAEFIAPRRLFI
jgi:hypothetical protein